MALSQTDLFVGDQNGVSEFCCQMLWCHKGQEVRELQVVGERQGRGHAVVGRPEV